MTRLIARLILAMLILPLSCALFALGIMTLASRSGQPHVLEVLALWAVVYLFIAVYWSLLWRDLIKWTPKRRRSTVLAGAVSLVVGVVVGLIADRVFDLPDSPAALVGGAIPPIAWVLATVLIWRETVEERLQRLAEAGTDTVSCPICSYNLTGLREARCPECGSQFTLDQLLAGQPYKDQSKL